MAKLKVTAKGQVTLKKDFLKHLGVKAGDEIEVDLLPDGEMKVHAVRKKGTINAFIGCLAGKSDKVATLEEIKEAIEMGWAGQR